MAIQRFHEPKDACPARPCCRFEIAADGSLVNIVRLCARHEAVKFGNGLTDAAIYDAIKASTRRRDRARYAAKIELGIDKEFPGFPFTLDALGNFIVTLGNYTKNADGTFTRSGNINTQTRNRVQTAVNAALVGVESPTGTAGITVI